MTDRYNFKYYLTYKALGEDFGFSVPLEIFTFHLLRPNSTDCKSILLTSNTVLFL